ncbi:unnamed protein product [Didymodactylos carnosus]|uniref:Uncharacterized protein n=1 Tax=Didymodactylos carnosus TaxID=1234261 RepID=A0A815D0W9_9BILA|nr:unnamed protein product [Didymodactylos carnosus]CAF1295072.1 unnamed protein product [Didymodactylos carnosus]CAF3868041.1 unnamed protein product [Didymodactylos carnosus]CAF4108232.1 unnamed protein product [Didymodactylos carnosus]
MVQYILFAILQVLTLSQTFLLGDNNHECVYQTKNGTLDMRTLGYSNGKPRFLDIPDYSKPEQYAYSWNGCFPFNEGDSCLNAAVCKSKSTAHFHCSSSRDCNHVSVFLTETLTTNETTLIITQNITKTFYDDESYEELDYMLGRNARVGIIFMCERDPNKQHAAAWEVTDYLIVFWIHDKCACPGECAYWEHFGN